MSRAPQMPVVSKIVTCQHLCQKNDLPSVLRKMLHHVSDRFQHRDIVALGRNALQEPRRRYFAYDYDGFRHPRLQEIGELRGRPASGVKLGVALTMVRQSGPARTDP